MRTVDTSNFTGMGTGRVLAGVAQAATGAAVKAMRTWFQRRQQGTSVSQIAGSGADSLEQTLLKAEYQPSTARKYALCVVRFVAAVGAHHLHHLRDDDVREYLLDLKASGLSNATLRLHLCALRAVFDGLLDLRITLGIRHAPRPLPRPPAEPDDVKHVMAACQTPHERLMIDLLNRLEVMPGKLCRLACREARAGTASPNCHTENAENGPTFRYVSLMVGNPQDTGIQWVFPSPRHEGPLSVRTVRRVVARAGASCGLHVTCTALRKAGEVRLPLTA